MRASYRGFRAAPIFNGVARAATNAAFSLGTLACIASSACGPSQPLPVEKAPIANIALVASARRPPTPANENPIAESDLDVPERDPRKFTGREEAAIRESYAAAKLALDQNVNALTLIAYANVNAELAHALHDPVARQKARTDAIALYATVTEKFTYSRLAIDALYYSSLESEIAGDSEAARKGYVDIVKNHPSSRFVPYAMFGFGELGFAEANSDTTKIELAAANFRYIAQADDKTSPIYPWALLRAGQLAVLAHDDASAAAAFGELDANFKASPAAARMHTQSH